MFGLALPQAAFFYVPGGVDLYEVPNRTLIPQAKTMSCWYASARMLLKWKMDKHQQSFAHLIPPDLDDACRKVRDANSGRTRIVVIAGIMNDDVPAPSQRDVSAAVRAVFLHCP